jgi:hypothetical protein
MNIILSFDRASSDDAGISCMVLIDAHFSVTVWHCRASNDMEHE